MTQSEKAIQFRLRHRGPGVLILPNVWDVASARVIEEAGFDALATTSAGIAYSLGYPDGQHISREEMIARVARIVRAVNIPVTADVEAGYGNKPEDAGRTARELIQAGAVGLNLEDTSGNPDEPLLDLYRAVDKIQAVRHEGITQKIPIVLNARTDVYMFTGKDAASQYAEAFRRLSTYRDAGADCVFVPGLKDVETIGRLVTELRCPVNILGGPGAPTVPELEKLGVARVSTGSGPMRSTLGLLRKIAEELKASGTFEALENAIPYAEMNQMLSRSIT